MRHPVLEKVTVSSQQSFAIKEEILPHIEIGWHFHPEYELTLFTESTGKRVTGDHTGSFGPGDLLLLGPNLPHYMRNDAVYYEGRPELRIRAIVVHFAEDFLGQGFFDIPEMAGIKKLLQRSARGLQIYGKTQARLAPCMERLLQLEGYERLRALLDILHRIAGSREQRQLASLSFQNTFVRDDAQRIDRVYDFMFQNFAEPVSLSEVAALVRMNNSAFCKFFKKRTGKTFSQVLNEIRVGYACKLFMDQGVSVSEACYRSGFNSLSYFNRQFKRITGSSPLAYRRRFLYGAQNG